MYDLFKQGRTKVAMLSIVTNENITEVIPLCFLLADMFLKVNMSREASMNKMKRETPTDTSPLILFNQNFSTGCYCSQALQVWEQSSPRYHHSASLCK